MSGIRFGTDGWRAVIAEDFTFANLERVAQASARVWKRQRIAGTSRKVVVGYDNRFLSPEFAERTAEVMAASGFQVILSDRPLPTPAVSYHVRASRACGGVMITASHNPPRFNGFKIKAHFGGSADPSLCRRIEAQLDRGPARRAPGSPLIRRRNILPGYARSLLKLVDMEAIGRSKLRLAHDALHGTGAGCFERLLEGTSCRVTALRAERNPGFGGINPEPIPSNYHATSRYLAAHPHDLCLVTDGDADRIGGMDGTGGPLTTHQIICLLLQHFVGFRKARGRVVKALTTTSMVDRMCRELDLPLVETGVGFKYICKEMLEGDVMLGFEESGGIGFAGHVPERDGLLAGLALLETLAVSRTPLPRLLARLEELYGAHHYARQDRSFPLERREELMERCRDRPPATLLGSPLERTLSFDGVKYIARNGAWLMLRGSGTEPVLRIYAESSSPRGTRSLIRKGAALAREVWRPAQ